MNHEAGICEWIDPNRPPAPTTDLTTRGTGTCSPLRYQYLVDWLTRLSITSVRKSPNMISTTGRRPEIAAPNAAPASASSEIGVALRPVLLVQPGRDGEDTTRERDVLAEEDDAVVRGQPSSSALRTAVRKSIVAVNA